MSNTVLLDLLEGDSEGLGILGAISGVKRTGGEGGLQCDLLFRWPVRTSAEARQIQKLIAGSAEMFLERDKLDDDSPAKAEFAVTRKFTDDSRHITVNLSQTDGGGGKVLISEKASAVVMAKFKTLKKAASLEVRIRVFGITGSDLGKISEGLSEGVGIHLTTDQASLFGGNVASLDQHRKALLPKVGQLVTAKTTDGTEMYGVVDRVADPVDGVVYLEIHDLEGDPVEIRADAVISALTVVPPTGKTVEAMLDGYVKKAKKAKTPPSIGAILVALGEAHADNLSPSESWMISGEITSQAAKINLSEMGGVDEEEEDEALGG